MHTNDEHSHLIPHPAIDDHPEQPNSAKGGFARLAGAIHEIRAQKESDSEPVLLFSGGDILGGPVFGWMPLLDGVAAERITGKHVDVAIQASGAIRANIKPGVEEWSEGQISFYDLIMSTGLGSGSDGLPGYPMVSFYLTESEVRKAMELSVLLSELRDNAYFLQLSGLEAAFDPSRAVLLTIPFSGTPIPTYRSVLSAYLVQEDGQVRALSNSDEHLLHIVSDEYIAGFLPMVGEILPRLNVVLKNEDGEPVNLEDIVIIDGDRQHKVWQAVLDYTLSHEVRMSGDVKEVNRR